YHVPLLWCRLKAIRRVIQSQGNSLPFGSWWTTRTVIQGYGSGTHPLILRQLGEGFLKLLLEGRVLGFKFPVAHEDFVFGFGDIGAELLTLGKLLLGLGKLLLGLGKFLDHLVTIGQRVHVLFQERKLLVEVVVLLLQGSKLFLRSLIQALVAGLHLGTLGKLLLKVSASLTDILSRGLLWYRLRHGYRYVFITPTMRSSRVQVKFTGIGVSGSSLLLGYNRLIVGMVVNFNFGRTRLGSKL